MERRGCSTRWERVRCAGGCHMQARRRSRVLQQRSSSSRENVLLPKVDENSATATPTPHNAPWARLWRLEYANNRWQTNKKKPHFLTRKKKKKLWVEAVFGPARQLPRPRHDAVMSPSPPPMPHEAAEGNFYLCPRYTVQSRPATGHHAAAVNNCQLSRRKRANRMPYAQWL